MEQNPEVSKFQEKDFVHLHLHTDYSLLHSTIQLKPLAERLSELDQKACAITDYGNMYGAVSFFNVMRAKNIKPVVGYEAYIRFGSRFDRSTAVDGGEKSYYNIILLASDLDGYQNLIQLSSKAFTEGFYYKPRIDLELLAEHSKGLIGLSGGIGGPVGHFLANGDQEKALMNAKRFEEILGTGRFFLEIQPHATERGEKLTKDTAELAKISNIDLVATNDVHYLSPEDARAHQVLICLGEGRTLGDDSRSAIENPTKYLRSADEMWAVFGDELPASLKNTVRITEMCDLEILQGEQVRQLPDYPIPVESQEMSVEEYFEKILWDGFEDRRSNDWEPMIALGTLKHSIEEYRSRLETEISTIKRMGFPGYFLIVWDFIRYAREHEIPVGPGRGSAAGSLAAYCLRITDVDPIQYDLLFERFLNPERVSMPDIDIDFCIRGRGEVINYVTDFYGRESVCQIITFGTMASRAAIKDVGRVLSMPFADVEKVAKLIPPPVRGRNVSISQAIKEVPELQAAMTDPKVKEVVDLALRLEGCARHTSVHAAGVVISPKPLHELVPVAINGKEEFTSQYPMNDLEKVGMLKMDFLGLTTLTVIADCVRSIKERLGETIDWKAIPTDEEKTMQLFRDGRTEAIFQFESSGMADMCRRLQPKDLEDLSALNALYRPGPLDGGMIDDFIDRHRGIKEIEYIVPEMEEFLSHTFGVFVYQEQIMQLSRKLAGFSLGDADLMRRAMGKKKIKEMAVHEISFINGAVERGINKKTAKEIFDLIAKFADYGFNRSHSMAYAILAFQTAYLKAHYPAYFYASVLTHEAQDAAKVYKYTTELKTMGLELLPPDVNESGEGFTPIGRTVRYGLTAIKGMGTTSVQAIVAARQDGKFTSLLDFCSRLGSGSVNKRGIESLIAAGAFDSLMPSELNTAAWRASLHAAIENALQQGQRLAEDRLRGQSGLFAPVGSEAETDSGLAIVTPWSQTELANREKAAVGFYLSTHPLDNFKDLLAGMTFKPIAEFEDLRSGDVMRLAGMISGLQIRTSKRGNRFAQFRFEDRSGGIKGVVLGENFNKLSSLLKDDGIFLAEGNIEAPEGQEPTLKVFSLRSLDEIEMENARELHLTIPAQSSSEADLESLFLLLERNTGHCSVDLNLNLGHVTVKLAAPGLMVARSRVLENELEERGCSVAWDSHETAASARTH